MTIGEKLLAARQAAGMTQQDVADRVGVTKQTIFKYENGIITNIPLDKLQAITDVLGVDPAVVMGWSASNGNGDLSALRERLRRQPGMRVLFDASDNATEQDLLDAAKLIEDFKKRREGRE